MAARKGDAKQSKGKRNRKHGRWSRAPSMKRYVMEKRYEYNKLRRMERHARKVAKKAARKARE